MATGKVVCSVLYSGQGMCNLVQVFDTADKLTYLFLFDFGCDKDKVTVEAATLPYLVKAITDHKKIDVLVMSHTDTDHWNVLPDLFEKLPKTVKVDKAAIPIGDWTGEKVTFKTTLEGRMKVKTDLTLFPAAYSNIGLGTAPITSWWNEDDVSLKILAASVKKSDVSSRAKKTTIETNTASVVVRCSFGTNNVVFTADATSFTIQYINGRMGTYKFPGNNLLTTAPHHGSITTLNGKWDVLKTFVDALKPQCVLASAEMKGGLNHPNACIVARMAAHLNADQVDDHELVLFFQAKSPTCEKEKLYSDLKKAAVAANKGDKPPDWFAFTTSKNIFTTLASKTTYIPRWIFTMNADNTTSVEQGAFTATADAGLSPQPFPREVQPEALAFTVGETLAPLLRPHVSAPVFDPVPVNVSKPER